VIFVVSTEGVKYYFFMFLYAYSALIRSNMVNGKLTTCKLNMLKQPGDVLLEKKLYICIKLMYNIIEHNQPI